MVLSRIYCSNTPFSSSVHGITCCVLRKTIRLLVGTNFGASSQLLAFCTLYVLKLPLSRLYKRGVLLAFCTLYVLKLIIQTRFEAFSFPDLFSWLSFGFLYSLCSQVDEVRSISLFPTLRPHWRVSRPTLRPTRAQAGRIYSEKPRPRGAHDQRPSRTKLRRN